MYTKYAVLTKKTINFFVPKIKEFWTSDYAVDFMTKVAYLNNGYYVPTNIDGVLNYNAKCYDDEQLSQNEIIYRQLVSVIRGIITPEKALETIKKQFIENEHPVAKSKDDESSEPTN